MNAKRVSAAAGVIHGSQKKGKQTAAGIAADLESAQLLQSPETAAEVEALRARVAELEAELRLLNTQRGDVAQLIERERGEGEECVDIDDLTAALSLGSDETAEAAPEERLLGEDELKRAVRGHLFGGGR